MKFCLLSDIHLESEPFQFPDPKTYDVIILAGNIVSWKSNELGLLNEYLERPDVRWKYIYIAGDHEHQSASVPEMLRETIVYPECTNRVHNNRISITNGIAILSGIVDPDSMDSDGFNTGFKKDIERFLDALDTWSKKDIPRLFITHHSPIDSSWANDIIKNNRIDVWCHGGTNGYYDFMHEGTRILSNPRGSKGFKPEGLIFEI